MERAKAFRKVTQANRTSAICSKKFTLSVFFLKILTFYKSPRIISDKDYTKKTDFHNQSARALSGPAMKSMSVYFPINFKSQNYFSKYFDNVLMNLRIFYYHWWHFELKDK